MAESVHQKESGEKTHNAPVLVKAPALGVREQELTIEKNI
jgi:hypothetical protein